MDPWLDDLRGKQKKDQNNLPDDDDDDDDDDERLDGDGAGADIPVEGQEDSDDNSSGDDQPPVRWIGMARKSVDAHMAQVGRELLFDLEVGRRSRSMLSRSSRAPSVASDMSAMSSVVDF